MKPGNKNSYNSLKSISIDNKNYKFYSLNEAEKNGLDGISKLPKSLKVLLENLLSTLIMLCQGFFFWA